MNGVADQSMAGAISKAAVVARLAVGAVLVLSGISKVVVPAEEFAMALEAYELLPIPVTMALAQIIPWVELFSGFFLVLGLAVRYAGAAAAALFIAFIAALGSTLLRGIPLEDCGCFGWGLPHLPPSQTILLDSALVVLSLIILLDEERRFTLDRWLRKSR